MREFYEIDQVIRKSEGKETRTWDEYWKYMLKDGHWADNWYVQASAFFLGMDYWIFDTTCSKEHPYFTIEGTLEDGQCSHGALYLGLAHEKHYQSLIDEDIKYDSQGPQGEVDRRTYTFLCFLTYRKIMSRYTNKEKTSSTRP